MNTHLRFFGWLNDAAFISANETCIYFTFMEIGLSFAEIEAASFSKPKNLKWVFIIGML